MCVGPQGEVWAAVLADDNQMHVVSYAPATRRRRTAVSWPCAIPTSPVCRRRRGQDVAHPAFARTTPAARSQLAHRAIARRHDGTVYVTVIYPGPRCWRLGFPTGGSADRKKRWRPAERGHLPHEDETAAIDYAGLVANTVIAIWLGWQMRVVDSGRNFAGVPSSIARSFRQKSRPIPLMVTSFDRESPHTGMLSEIKPSAR